MTASGFKVQRLDHVHILVRNRATALAWYRRILGLEVHYDYTEHGDPRGPIVLSSDGGETHLALFQASEAFPAPDAANKKTVAFRVDANGFCRFVDRLAELDVRSTAGARVTRAHVSDHGNVYSVYFADPDGNPYEITTYDYAEVGARLG
jgi:catechol 2,3-dioxygenase-like lactoylglutathione lyase family enzyme